MSASRRRFLQALSAAGGLAAVAQTSAASRVGGAAQGASALGDSAIAIRFDERLRSQVWAHRDAQWVAVTGLDSGESVRLAKGAPITRFARTRLEHSDVGPADSPHGAGKRLRLVGRSAEGLEKTVTLTLHAAHPGFALLQVQYLHRGAQPLSVTGWSNASHHLPGRPGDKAASAWSFSGATHEDRRDWIGPVKPDSRQPNSLGMTASDYGGGTPVADVWRRDGGLAVGHVEREPRLVSLPVRSERGGASVAVSADTLRTLALGDTLDTVETFITVHEGDYFRTLDAYRRLMAERGLAAPAPPATAYEPVWCAWGYEREFSIDRVAATLPKVRELGFKWAVLDDGWQRLTGDWTVNKEKFPRGEADLRALVGRIRDEGLRPRLWIAPLAVAPGSDALHDHADMLLLNKDGAVQNVTWWNSFTLCPAYEPTLTQVRALVRTIIGDWGFDGLKIDGQHLNSVAPCFNPAHRHARPEESLEKLSLFYKAMYDEARAIKPDAVVELCPCGTAYAFHNLPFMNQAPASDPLSSWQVRHKGKTLKALMGRSAAYAGDHVELSDGGQDFASTVGIGGVVSTKFTWPEDPKPKDSFLLTPERERAWRHWNHVYLERDLARGRYRGELYDIAFDKPETHVVEQNGRLHYAFYAKQWSGPITLRGLGPGRYAVRDYVNARLLGRIDAARPVLDTAFEGALLVVAEPLA